MRLDIVVEVAAVTVCMDSEEAGEAVRGNENEVEGVMEADGGGRPPPKESCDNGAGRE
jgi:hypothetical protein